jgi:hypothetical protein
MDWFEEINTQEKAIRSIIEPLHSKVFGRNIQIEEYLGTARDKLRYFDMASNLKSIANIEKEIFDMKNLELVRTIRDSIDLFETQKMHEKFFSLKDSMRKSFESMNSKIEKFKPFLDTIQAQMAGTSEAIREAFELVGGIDKIFPKLSDQYRYLDTFKDNLTNFSLNFAHFDFPGYSSILDSFKDIEFEFRTDGYLLLNGEKYHFDDIQNEIDNLIEDEDIGIYIKEKNWENAIKKLIASSKTKKSDYLITFIIGVLSSLIASIIFYKSLEEYSSTKNISNRNTKVIVKKIKKKSFPETIYLENVRYVSVNTLYVREKNAKKSLKIGELHIGNVVQILRKKADWSLIYYKFEDIELKGWVFSRYLKKFRKHFYF